MSAHLIHRQLGYNLLTGHGLEIGAFRQPATLPPNCTIEYCDRFSKAEATQYFPEINGDDLVEVNHICDLDTDGLSLFPSNSFDFVVSNHVIEHIANPIKVVEELFRVIKPQGQVVISAPDKAFTFDKNRAITPFAHLQAEYDHNVTEVTDAHYVDFLRGVHPQVLNLTGDHLQVHINHAKNRREHAHVWDSLAFHDFMLNTIKLLQLPASCLFVSPGKLNKLEYFAVWKKW